MISRREFLQAFCRGFGAFTAFPVMATGANWPAQQTLTQDDLLKFDTFGNLSIIHITDIHAHLKPIWFANPNGMSAWAM